jgi:putative ABC transport system permease protein
VDAGYFATVRQPLLRGRGFTPADMTPTSRAMVITASVASKLWPGEDPIGKPLRVIKQAPGRSDTGQPLDGEVIGVVGDVKFGSLADSATAEVYLPIPVNPWRNTFVVARVAGDQAAYIRAMRRALASVDRDIATDDINLATQLVSGMLSERRFYLQLLSAFAASALALASFGVYGVIAFGLTQRRHEIGVRTALGAQRAALLRLFIREGFAMAVIGVAIGLPLAAFSTRILASMLYGVATLDVATFGAVTLLLVLVALAASYLPARRLTRVDPAEALKAE